MHGKFDDFRIVCVGNAWNRCNVIRAHFLFLCIKKFLINVAQRRADHAKDVTRTKSALLERSPRICAWGWEIKSTLVKYTLLAKLSFLFAQERKGFLSRAAPGLGRRGPKRRSSFLRVSYGLTKSRLPEMNVFLQNPSCWQRGPPAPVATRSLLRAAFVNACVHNVQYDGWLCVFIGTGPFIPSNFFNVHF